MDQKNMDMGKGAMNACEMCDHKHEGDCEDCGACGKGGSCKLGSGICGRGCHRGWRWFFKLLVVLFVLAAVFSAGALVGAVKVLRHGGTTVFSGMMGQRGTMNYGWSQMMSGWRKDEARAFGDIVKVEGNKITFTDNGGKEGVILSTTATTIVSGENPAALSALKAGQTVSAYGTLNGDSQLEASWIAVQ